MIDISKFKRDVDIMVSSILKELISTENDEHRIELALLLVDRFRDKRIIPALISLIKRKDLAGKTGTLIYACNEYSPEECKEYMELFIELIINGTYETAWGSAQLVLDFPEPFEWSDELLDKMESNLKTALKTENPNKEFIEEVLRLFEK